jgi:alcohol dehydrogenase (NADP+)
MQHWPVAFKRGDNLFPFENKKALVDSDYDFIDTWKAVEKVFKSGKAKAIGISNFSKAEIEKLLANTDVVPAAHQLELHPYLAQTDFTKWNQSKGIHVTAYSPFGNSNPIYTKGKEVPQLIQLPELAKIGEKYGKSGAQVALAWAVNQGWSVLPKSKTEARIKANFEGDFKLEDEDIKAITALDKKLRFNDPSESFSWDFYTDLDGK